MSETALPLHRRITADVTGRITSGAWPPGTRIPFEHEMMATYRCSRMTVSKALGELARIGLIERRRRSGSFVAAPRAEAAVLEISDIRDEVEALGLAHRFELLGHTLGQADAKEREALGLGRKTRVLRLEGRHWAGDKPFCREVRMVSLDAVPEARAAQFDGATPGAWLIARVPWSAAEHRILAAGADARTAELLETPDGAPCLVVERRTWMAGNAESEKIGVTAVCLTYRAESHALVARFTPAQR